MLVVGRCLHVEVCYGGGGGLVPGCWLWPQEAPRAEMDVWRSVAGSNQADCARVAPGHTS